VRAVVGNSTSTSIHVDYSTASEDELEAVIAEHEKFTLVEPTEEEYEWVDGEYADFWFVAKVNAPGAINKIILTH
jgi:hypothetical protein